ncbi:MAG: YbaK/EbsC family protein [Breznakibacter sp.]|nr:YbaK/EbsC family protein [Breznakibacter sp.]
MPLSRLEQYLHSNRIDYKRIIHGLSYSSQRTASSTHISGYDLAKTVILKADSKFIMAVVPATSTVDLNQLKRNAGFNQLRLATEYEFKDLFRDCEVGAMPPFGNLYNIDVYIAEPLTHDTLIAFNACTHTELLQITYSDFHRLVKPRILKFTTGPLNFQA